MKRVLAIVFVLFIVIAGYGTFSFLPDYLTNKMNRHLSKLFGKHVTYIEVPLHDSLNMDHQLFQLYEEDSVIGYSMISRALGCRIGGCDKPKASSEGYEQFFYMTVFNKEKGVECVRVLEYTSDYGYQVANKGWLKQFRKDETFEVGKNIDGITGATVSVSSITKGINTQRHILNLKF